MKLEIELFNVKDNPPPKESILVLGKCGMFHVTKFDYDEHMHTEHCIEEFPGNHVGGGATIYFDWWGRLPKGIENSALCKKNRIKSDLIFGLLIGAGLGSFLMFLLKAC